MKSNDEAKVCDCNQGRLPCTCKTEQQSAGFTAVDMTTAAAQGFRDGQASVVVQLPKHYAGSKDPLYCVAYAQKCREAIIAAGGSVKD